MIKHYGLTGNPLIHSFSEKIFNEKFRAEGISDAAYSLLPLADIRAIRDLVKEKKLSGFNVTIPYKQSIIPFLDELNEDAQAIGAVNTVKVQVREKGIYLKGYNTDAPAFQQTLKRFELIQQAKALVLGNGGASRAVCYALRQLGIEYQLVSRTPAPGIITYQDIRASLLSEHLLVINTTPLGMYPEVQNAPDLPYQAFTEAHIAYDLIYNPETTLFLRQAGQNGATIINGLEMLRTQADLAWKIWQEA